MSPGPRAAQLNEVGALAVAEPVCTFGIHSYWPGSGTEGSNGVSQSFRSGDDRRHTIRGRGEQLRFLIEIRCGERYVGQCLRELRLGGLRREGIITTPAGSGGRPASVQSSSAQPAR